jgi:hypothetical protein
MAHLSVNAITATCYSRMVKSWDMIFSLGISDVLQVNQVDVLDMARE